MRAWWSGDLTTLLAEAPEAIVQCLAVRLIETHHLNHAAQLTAWRAQVALLQTTARGLPGEWRVLLEYPLLRLAKRIDAVLLTDRAILVLEFKAADQTRMAREQVEDYALDLFDFHADSRAHPVVPILVVTQGQARATAWPLFWHAVSPVLDATERTLPALVHDIAARIPAAARPLDTAAWEAAPYRPVPTIVEAATMLYRRHGVAEIAAARADVGNLTRTNDAIAEAIMQARADDLHLVLFVTGIPGAGKTLCGLNIVFGADSDAAFLTGNLPLVHVMREALARDARDHGRSMRMARQQTESAIQPLIGFLRDNRERTDPPHEHVVVFDEAQRAWDAAFGARRFGHDQSEAAMFLDIMRRHRDWAVIVALVGTGQEINTGEAGLEAWGEALLQRPDWQIRAPQAVLAAADLRQRLFVEAPATLTIDPRLHLAVPVRSVRCAAAAPWVDAVLRGDAAEAAEIAANAITSDTNTSGTGTSGTGTSGTGTSGTGAVPFLVTRSLPAMRAALRLLARGQRRAGLVCSAGAKRLRADGVWPNFPHLDADAVAHWFLDRWPDVRASDALELPATQFACQGLELDQVGLCWGNDLIRQPGRAAWQARGFVGTRWQVMRKEAAIAYQVNTYRVLLTRARYETLIWIPQGDTEDATREPAVFDAIARFLTDCGAHLLEETEVHETPAEPIGTLL
jgi:hypothetical protein